MTDTNEKQRFDQGEVPLARKVDRMGMLIHRYYEAKAHDHGAMGDPLRGQGRVLALLKAKPETTQRELSYLLDMRQQSLSELLAKLEEKGFVTRDKSETDGRVTVVRLTDAGAEAAPSPEQMQGQADALDCLDEEEQAQLDALTTKVTESLEQKLEEMGVDPHRGPRRDHGPRRDKGDRGGRRGDSDGRGGRRGDSDGRGGRRDDADGRGPRRPYDDHGPHRGPNRSEKGDGEFRRGPNRPGRGNGEFRHGPYRPRDNRDDSRRWQA